jgi:hypothetical protein
MAKPKTQEQNGPTSKSDSNTIDYSLLPPAFHPRAFQLPTPALDLDFRLVCDLATRIPVGPTPTGGQRNWIGLAGGRWAARWGSGSIVPGGQDSQVVSDDKTRTWVSTHYLLQTDDTPEPAHIAVHTEGWRTGPKDVMERLFDPDRADAVGPEEYRFRLFVQLETGDERYREEIAGGMWVAAAARLGNRVVYDAYRIA